MIKQPPEEVLLRAISTFINNILESQDTNLINGVAGFGVHSWDALEARIVKMEYIRDTFHKFCTTAIANLRKPRNHLTSFGLLPVELTTEILLASFRPKDRSRVKRLQEIASVQTLWRDIILSNPRFWTTFSTTDNVLLKLRKSRNLPLTFAVHNDDEKSESTVSLFHTAAKETYRWKTVQCSGTAGVTLGMGMFLRNPLPLLESLDVRGWKEEYLDLTSFEGGPRLRHVRLHATFIRWPVLKGLTTLSIVTLSQNTPSLTELLQALAACPELEALELREITQDVSEHLSDQPPLILPNLRSLVVWDVDLFMELGLVSHLMAEGLTHFRLAQPEPHSATARTERLLIPYGAYAKLLDNAIQNIDLQELSVKLASNDLDIQGVGDSDGSGVRLLFRGCSDLYLTTIAQTIVPASTNINFSARLPSAVHEVDVIRHFLGSRTTVTTLILRGSISLTFGTLELLFKHGQRSTSEETDASVRVWPGWAITNLQIDHHLFTRDTHQRWKLYATLRDMLARRQRCLTDPVNGTLPPALKISNFYGEVFNEGEDDSFRRRPRH